jgi:hypothetical protein
MFVRDSMRLLTNVLKYVLGKYRIVKSLSAYHAETFSHLNPSLLEEHTSSREWDLNDIAKFGQLFGGSGLDIVDSFKVGDELLDYILPSREALHYHICSRRILGLGVLGNQRVCPKSFGLLRCG